MPKEVAKKNDQAIVLPAGFDIPDGAGLEDADRDSFAIPFLAVLQKTSPQADADHEAYIDGSKPGMLLDTVANDLIDPEKEDVKIIPCFYRRAFIEWKTRNEGGGFVREHSVVDAENLLKQSSRNESNQDILPNGNQIVDTRYHYVILVRGDGNLQPMVITMSSTQVKKSKRLNSDLKLQTDAGVLRATFQRLYKVKTVTESNEHGSWRGWDIKRDELVADQTQFDTAFKFYQAIKSGEVKEATDSLNPDGAVADENQF